MFSVKKFINSVSLKQRLIILIVVTTLFTVFINYYTTIVFSRNKIENKTLMLTENSVSQISQNIDDSLLKQIYIISNMIAYDSSVIDIVTKTYNETEQDKKSKLIDELMLGGRVLEKYLSVNEDIKIAAIIGNNNQLYNISYPPSNNPQIVYDKVIKMVDTSRNYSIKWYPLEKNYFTSRIANDKRGQYILIARKGIFSPITHEYLGTCLFAIEENSINERYKSTKLGESGQMFILDEHGKIISSDNVQELDNKVSTNNGRQIVDKILSNPSGTFDYKKNGENLLVVTRKSHINNWITVGVVPKNEVFEEVNNIYNIVLIIAIVTIICEIILVTILTDCVVKPIRTVVNALSEVENGNLNVSVNIKGDYEASKLGKYFNSMIKRIRQLVEEQFELGKKIKGTELDLLMSQINPHFLYNTLDSISWMAQSGYAAEAGKMTESLGKMLRIGITTGDMIISVAQEIQHVKAYMDIQKIRYKDKFNFAIEIQNDYIYEYKTLKLILQPLVENSLFYGLDTATRQINIKISIMVIEDKLVFKVYDDGAGISEEKLQEINIALDSKEEQKTKQDNNNLLRKKGIGVKNINERIKLNFGNQYGIKIDSVENRETVVTLELPLLFELE